MKKSEIRKDYIQDKYVIIAPKRGKRPHTIAKKTEHENSDKKCVFCPNILEKNNTIEYQARLKQDSKVWDVAVIKNKFPAVTLDNSKAYGIQEVVVETPKHLDELEDLSPTHIAKILEVYSQRTERISQNLKIEYILIFKNDGGRAGASIQHAHSQIFATSFLPPHLFDKSQKVQAYKLQHGSCVYCDVIKKESRGKRLIYKDKYVITFTPYASVYNYEVWIMPIRHIDNVTMMNTDERASFAEILKKILKKIGKLNMAYNYYFHQVINDEDQHLYMKIVPRGSVWAGVEIGSGIVINPIPPEEAAKYYKK